MKCFVFDVKNILECFRNSTNNETLTSGLLIYKTIEIISVVNFLFNILSVQPRNDEKEKGAKRFWRAVHRKDRVANWNITFRLFSLLHWYLFGKFTSSAINIKFISSNIKLIIKCCLVSPFIPTFITRISCAFSYGD